MSLFALHCQVQHYPWGSTTSIPRLIHRPNPEALPWAEMWMGAHPKASSSLPNGEELIDYLSARDQELPFLFKILAAASPLSIQCHPDKAQAAAGFARENIEGIALDAPNRNYRDANHKPEIIVALEEFWALKGFRPAPEIAQLFRRAGVSLLADQLAQGLESFTRELFSLSTEQRSTLLSELAAGCSLLPADEARWIRELLRLYPGDIGCAAPLFLRLVRLDAGEALYLGAGELHAYLQGTGLELMANSDNVLRGGLTNKHVDAPKLLSVLRFEARDLEVLHADDSGRYPSECEDFQLRRFQLGEPRTRTPTSMEIWLCLEGRAELVWNTGSLSLEAGQVAFAEADSGEVSFAGSGQLWIASST